MSLRLVVLPHLRLGILMVYRLVSQKHVRGDLADVFFLAIFVSKENTFLLLKKRQENVII